MSGEELAPLFTWRSAITDSDLKPVTRHVALTLSLHMNERGGSCWPSMPTLAAETGLAVDTVRTHMKALTQRGWLKRTDRPGQSSLWNATVPTTAIEPSSPTPPLRHPSSPAPLVPDPTGARRESHPSGLTAPTPPVPPETSTSLSSSVNSPVAPTSSTRSRKPPSSKPPPTPRKPDLLWEALLAACGIDPDELTDSARGAANKAAAQLRGVNATPAQVKLRARVWPQRFEGATLTPTALARHWAQLAPNVVGGPEPPNAALAAADADQRRARGEACARCHDRGTYELEDGTAVQCDHQPQEETP